jgi:hypothetical protein
MWDETYGLAERGTVGLRMGVVVLAIVCAAVEPDEVIFREGVDEVDLCMVSW